VSKVVFRALSRVSPGSNWLLSHELVVMLWHMRPELWPTHAAIGVTGYSREVRILDDGGLL
jgi:hypothetical protein